MQFPQPKKSTKYRVFGPILICGMNVWRIFEIATNKQVGSDCFSAGEAESRVKDILSGKKVYWFGNNSFIKKNIY